METMDLFRELYDKFNWYCERNGELWDEHCCEVESVDFTEKIISGKLVCMDEMSKCWVKGTFNVSIQKLEGDDYRYIVQPLSSHEVYHRGSDFEYTIERELIDSTTFDYINK